MEPKLCEKCGIVLEKEFGDSDAICLECKIEKTKVVSRIVGLTSSRGIKTTTYRLKGIK